MVNFGDAPTIELLDGLPTVELTRELVLEAELATGNGLLSEEAKEHIVNITNTHLITSGEPRDVWVLAEAALFLTGSLPDVEFMTDKEIAATLHEGRTVAKGRLYGVEHLATTVFSGFGLRLFGVELRIPVHEHRDSLFVPVDSVSLTVAAK